MQSSSKGRERKGQRQIRLGGGGNFMWCRHYHHISIISSELERTLPGAEMENTAGGNGIWEMEGEQRHI